MKQTILLLIASVALNAQAAYQCFEVSPVDMGCSRGEFITNVGCDNFDNLRCARSFTSKDYEQNIIGRVVDLLAGELDPHVLGDGSLMVLKGKSTYVVYEPLENGLLPALKELNNEVEVIVGIPRSSLEKPTRNAKSAMKSLATRHMNLNLNQKAEYFEVLD